MCCVSTSIYKSITDRVNIILSTTQTIPNVSLINNETQTLVMRPWSESLQQRIIFKIVHKKQEIRDISRCTLHNSEMSVTRFSAPDIKFLFYDAPELPRNYLSTPEWVFTKLFSTFFTATLSLNICKLYLFITH